MLERGQTERHIDRQTDRQTDRLFGREFILAVQLTFVSPAKMAKPIDMPYRGLIPVGPRNHVLHGGRDPLRLGAIFGVVHPLKHTGSCSYCSIRRKRDQNHIQILLAS